MSMKPLQYVGAAILAFLVGLGSAVEPWSEGIAQGCTVTLSPGSSIQEAINRAAQGDVICLLDGEWKENIVIEKGLTIRAAEVKPEPDAVISSAKEGWPVIMIRSEEQIEVAIVGLKITGAFVLWWCYDYPICADGISVHGQAKAIIQSNTISGNLVGIMMVSSSQASILNSTISGNVGGIMMRGSSRATVRNSSISDNKELGIWMMDSTQATIENTTISGNGWIGIVMSGSSQASIFNNLISNTWGGIGAADSSQATIINNTIRSNEVGILMVGSSQAAIESNTISDNKDSGIVTAFSSQATIMNNKIVNNGEYGVACSQQPCFDADSRFDGSVRGCCNEISGNNKADVCPKELEFLKTSAGGCYGPKC